METELPVVTIDRACTPSENFTDLAPLDALREGFVFDGERISFA